jgi:hypothetical protein
MKDEDRTNSEFGTLFFHSVKANHK